MKKIMWILILSIFLSQPLSAESVNVITYHYPPYVVGDGSGILELILHKVSKYTKHKIKFEKYPLKRASLTFGGDYKDKLFLGVYHNLPKQPVSVRTQIFIRTRIVSVYYKKDFPKFNYTSFEELKGKTIGVLFGNPFNRVLVKYGLKQEKNSQLKNNLKKLVNQRIDFWLVPDITAYQLIEKEMPGMRDLFGFFEDRKAIPLLPISLVAGEESNKKKVFTDICTGLKKIVKNGKCLKILEGFYGKGLVPDGVMVKF
ncbi:MAG: amino acid ABC transporter substrate-binding protein [Desulfobacterales bacterium]|nr:amino acid ABC transporter substrate-binding protein [Desulfobacterales bacterium]MCP4158770.1 amino acid ABC transporter substrate-binding protein [Deltaproteobacteria bacterium]